MRKNYYVLSAIEDLINKYVNLGGELYTIHEGSLGYGVAVLHGAKGKCSIVIKEEFLNAWSSTHTIRQYNKLPKKYEKYIN